MFRLIKNKVIPYHGLRREVGPTNVGCPYLSKDGGTWGLAPSIGTPAPSLSLDLDTSSVPFHPSIIVAPPGRFFPLFLATEIPDHGKTPFQAVGDARSLVL